MEHKNQTYLIDRQHLIVYRGGRATIWGTGLMTAEAVNAMKDADKKMCLDIRAVRGPLTRMVLMSNGFGCPAVYGDPAILMPLFFFPKVNKQRGKVLIIPHFSKADKYRASYGSVIDTLTCDWQWFITEIVSAEKVISSSLHGIILAESYGIPVVMLNDFPGSRFKYDDYYQSTGRTSYPLADTVEEAMEMTGDINHNLLEMQRNLLATFPKDIF